MAQQPSGGSGDSGSGQLTLATAGTDIILGPIKSKGANRIYVDLLGNQVHKLQLEISKDGGTTWNIVKQISSAASGDATYANFTELDAYMPLLSRVSVTQSSGSNMLYIYDARVYNLNQG